jgi:hypothetical protein
VNGRVSSGQFLTALKNAFLNHKITLEFEYGSNDEEESTCSFTIEFNFVALGGPTSLKLLLTKLDNPYHRITSVFLHPLQRYHATRQSDSVDSIEAEIKQYEAKITALEKGEDVPDDDDEEEAAVVVEPATPQEHSTKAPSPPPHEPIPDINDNSDNKVEQPFSIKDDKIISILKEIRDKLRSTKSITINEEKSFDRVFGLLENNENNKWGTEHVNDVDFSSIDMETVSWIKSKYAQYMAEQKESVPQSDVVKLIPASEWKSSLITQPAVRQNILDMFDKLDNWHFDVFAIDEWTNGHALFVTAYTLMVKYDFIRTLNIPEQKLINFLREVESGYHPNPYHNAMHAADVLQVVHHCVAKSDMMQHLSHEEIFSVLFSAIIHDYDHPGLNNAFLVNTRSYLATLYNDRSVLENHHSAQSFALMNSSPKFNVLSEMKAETRKAIRDNIVAIVLATDMGRHAKIVNKFKNKVEQGLDWKKKEDIRLVLQITIKVADVNNTSRPLYLYLKWADRIINEFYIQGDKEREADVPVTPLMDRTKANMAKGQIAFANYLVIPMFKIYADLLPKMKFMLNYLEDTKKYWEEHEEVEQEYLVPRPQDRKHEEFMDAIE